VSATLFAPDQASFWLVDSGEGTQHQLLKKNLTPTKICKVFITHLHGDHCLGLPGLLAMRSMKHGTAPVEIYGPEGIRLLVETALQTTQTFLPFPLAFMELKAGQSYPALVRSGAWTAAAYPLQHRVPCWGFVFTEETPPKFSAEAALAAGVPRGAVIAELARGIRQELTLDDGTVVRRDSLLVRGPLGRKIVILGDTCDSQGIAEAAAGCDLLVHEATFHSSLQERAIASGHSTGPMAAQFAVAVQARQLVLTHFSQRHHTPGAEFTVADIVAESAQLYRGTLLAAADLMDVQVEPHKMNQQAAVTPLVPPR
jgi:ribonuclease Z